MLCELRPGSDRGLLFRVPGKSIAAGYCLGEFEATEQVDRVEQVLAIGGIAVAASRTLGEGTWLKMLRYQCTMQRCQRASGKNSAALSASPRQASEMISRTPLRPRSLRCLRKPLQPALSSLAPSQMPRISR